MLRGRVREGNTPREENEKKGETMEKEKEGNRKEEGTSRGIRKNDRALTYPRMAKDTVEEEKG